MRKLRTVCAAVFVGAVMSAALAGCDSQYERYGGASLYTEGEPEVAATQVSAVEVDWTAGAVFVNVSDSATGISVDDSYEGSGEFAMRYFLDRGTLEIKFAKAGARIPADFEKTLTITLPASMVLRELEIDTLSADVNISSVTATETAVESRSGDIVITGVSSTVITADTASGSILIRDCSFAEGEADTASGDATFILGDIAGFRLDFESRGALNDEFGAVRIGREYVYGNGLVEINFESRSGNLTLAANGGTQD